MKRFFKQYVGIMMAAALTVCSTKGIAFGSNITDSKKDVSSKGISSEKVELSEESFNLYDETDNSIDNTESGDNDQDDRRGPGIDEPQPIFICDINTICEE